MKRQTACTVVKFIVLVTFLAMIVVNALAALLPINGITPGEVSDAYPNLFAPAGLTFSIWGVIYALLALFTGYQLLLKKAPEQLICRLGIVFSLSSVANILWIFAWHHQIIPLSAALMLILLVCLIWCLRLITSEELGSKEKFFVKLPFAVYLGWITVATIANITVLLVSLGWDGFGLSEQTWTVLVLAIGAVIGILAGLRFKSAAYLLVFIWAYVGIVIKHVSEQGFGGRYPAVIVAAAVCIALFALAVILLLVRRKNMGKSAV